jgi:YihY family inner membrane protein
MTASLGSRSTTLETTAGSTRPPSRSSCARRAAADQRRFRPRVARVRNVRSPPQTRPIRRSGGWAISFSGRPRIDRVDQAQQRRTWIAFPLAVAKKFGDDRAGSLAALVAYYGFISLFPLLLVLVTVAGFVLADRPQLQERVVNSALAQFPIVGSEIEQNIGRIDGDGLTLVIGLAAALWTGLAVMATFQRAMDEVWDVPRRARPRFLQSRLRGLLMLAVLGVALGASALLTSIGGALEGLGLLRVAGLAGALAINIGAIAAAYRILTAADVSWRDVLPGAAVAGTAWVALQAVGAWLVSRRVQGAGDVYGFFAIVIGLLFWIYLAAQVLLVGAEINVVRARKLWPRSLSAPPTLEADRRSLARQAVEQEVLDTQRVDVRFEDERNV